MSIARALAVLGAGAGGYAEGQEAARKRRREEEDDAFRREQRDRMRKDWSQADEDRARQRAQEEALNKGAAPVTAAPAGMRDESADDRDVGQPDGPSFGIRVGQQVVPTQAAADASMAQQNSVAGTMARMAALPGVTAEKRLQLAQGAQAAEVSAMQLAEAKRQAAIRLFDDGIRSAAKSWDDLAKFLSDSPADGMDGAAKFAVKRKDGKVTLYPVGPDGTALGNGTTFSDDESGRAMAAFMFARGTSPEQKLTHIRALENDAAARADRDADNKRKDRELRLKERLTGAQIAELGRRGTGAAGAAAAPVSAGIPWDDKASAFLRQRYTISDPTTGEVMVDGQGIDFAKQIAMAEVARNGGDLDRALGRAFQIDNKIKTEAGRDPAKVAQARQALLAALMAPPAQAAPAPAPAAAPRQTPPPSTTNATMAGAAPPARSDATSQMVANQQAAVVEAHKKVQEAKAMLAAVSKSGDPRALQLYAQQMQAAITERDRIAAERLGNNAARFIASLPE